MKKIVVCTAAALLMAAPALARDTIVNVRLADVLDMPQAKQKLDGSVKFFLLGQATPAVLKTLGEDQSNPKTWTGGKTDEFACKWVILTALINFQSSAKREGANAVVNLVSYYRKNETRSDTTIECHAGGVLAGVTLKGSYAKVQD